MPSNLRELWNRRPISVWRYKELLPFDDNSKIVTLNEGGTGLHRCPNLEKDLGISRLYAKNEGENPTASFKDRGMTVGVSKALELKMKMVACASTGNTSASLAAYSARAGLNCIVLIPSGKIALGKLAQAIIHDAKIIAVKGNFDDALAIVRKLCLAHPIYLLNSVNPFRLEGQKTLAMEIVDQLGHVPDNVILPVGNAGNISAAWKGFGELNQLELIDRLPKMIGVQAEGASPIVDAIKNNRDSIEPIANPETLATAIRIGYPVNWKRAIWAIKESHGLAEKVSDKDILEAQSLLASKEGLFVEAASASSIAGLKKLLNLGMIGKDEEVVCVTTGHGLKDTKTVLDKYPLSIKEVEANFNSMENLLKKEKLL